MSTDKEHLENLETSYRKLLEQHEALREQIQRNYAEILALRNRTAGYAETKGIDPVVAVPRPESVPAASRQPEPVEVTRPKAKQQSDWEHFIGEQLLSKIGIAILIIGVGIGAKYAIDHQLLSYGMRIAGGYAVAAVLGFFAYRFREKYTGFSAVLVSGAMAVTYFISYAGFSFYHLYPYGVAFGLLLLTTIATVAAAIRYNQVIIAHIGLVGAYVLPVLIAAKASNIANYFAYMAVINCGILVISFLRNWRSLFHVAFGWTTIVFGAWVLFFYGDDDSQATTLLFTVIYFVLFQAVSLAYPLVRKQSFHGLDLFMVIPNMLAFFVIGQYLLYGQQWGSLGADFVFGLIVSALFFGLWRVFKSLRPEDSLLRESHFVIGAGALTLSFLLTLDGPHLPLILVLEACTLGWLALQSKWRFLDIFSTVLVWIAGVVLFFVVFDRAVWRGQLISHPFLSESFWSMLAAALIAGITFSLFRRRFDREQLQQSSVSDGLLLFALISGYGILLAEIVLNFRISYRLEHETFLKTGEPGRYAGQWSAALLMVTTAFSALYWAFVSFLNRRVVPFRNAGWMPTVSIVFIGLFLLLVSLNARWPDAGKAEAGGLEMLYVFARYATFAAIAAIAFPWLKNASKDQKLLTAVHITVLWILSLEMTHWLDVNGYKLSLSILWGIYAIYMLYIGIVRGYAGLRVAAMIVLGITLAKLFFFDIARLSTIAKTVLFILLGGLLLTGAYFYQRYQTSEEAGDDERKQEGDPS